MFLAASRGAAPPPPPRRPAPSRLADAGDFFMGRRWGKRLGKTVDFSCFQNRLTAPACRALPACSSGGGATGAGTGKAGCRGNHGARRAPSLERFQIVCSFPGVPLPQGRAEALRSPRGGTRFCASAAVELAWRDNGSRPNHFWSRSGYRALVGGKWMGMRAGCPRTGRGRLETVDGAERVGTMAASEARESEHASLENHCTGRGRPRDRAHPGGIPSVFPGNRHFARAEGGCRCGWHLFAGVGGALRGFHHEERRRAP